MEKYNIIHNKWFKPAVFLAAGLLLGWLFFHHSESVMPHETADVHQHNGDEKGYEVWTCAMHPQIRMDKPGLCPICAMELIPVQQGVSDLHPDAIHMTEEAMKLADVQTTVIGRQNAQKEIHLYGKIQADERRVKTQSAHVAGRVEELLISFTGEAVRKGQVIARIYSPSIVTAQEELLQAKQMIPSQPALIDAAREKLRQWKLTNDQIAAIEKNGKVQRIFDVTANVSGIVLTKKVNQGDYIQQGTPLFEVVDLSSVWVLFDAYESDLPWIKMGSAVSFTLQSMPGQKFSGNITFIDPLINPATRVALVRVEAQNRGGKLKPEMFVDGTITSGIPEYRDGLVIPQSAVLWTGSRSVVYVKIQGAESPEFVLREIELGPALSNAYVVLDGLKEGVEIVTNGTFAVDASAQLAGKPSMMNPEGNQRSPNSMPGMDMSQGKAESKGETPGAITKKEMTMNDDADLKTQMTHVYQSYLTMKDAFVATDAKKVSQYAAQVAKSLDAVDMGLLKGDRHMVWMTQLKTLKQSLQTIISLTDIEKQRAEFVNFNATFYQSVKTFGLKEVTAYYQYCPMANGDKGAYWFSDSKEIRNPYMGDKMLSCGETRETFQ